MTVTDRYFQVHRIYDSKSEKITSFYPLFWSITRFSLYTPSPPTKLGLVTDITDKVDFKGRILSVVTVMYPSATVKILPNGQKMDRSGPLLWGLRTSNGHG